MCEMVDRCVVLIVDDEPAVRHVLGYILEAEGFAVRLAASGSEAVTLFRSQPGRFSLILIDVRMPYLDGPATLAAMRETDPDLLCCFMSGDETDPALDQAVQWGAAGILAKPFRFDELGGTLRAIIESKKPWAECGQRTLEPAGVA